MFSWISLLILLVACSISLSNSNFSVMIGILSARENFEQRHALRQTWLSDLRETNLRGSSVKFKFIVGNMSCPIPPRDRVEKYGCKKVKSNYTNSVPASQRRKKKDCQAGFYFSTSRRIKVTSLGVADCFITSLLAPVRVKMKTIEGKLLASSTFHKNFSLTKSIQSVVFPPFSEGLVFVETSEKINCCLDLDETEESESPVRTWPIEHGLGRAPGVPLYFKYEVDADTGADVTNISLEWQEHVKNFDLQIVHEMKVHQDLLLIDLIDVYSNLPKKLIGLISAADEAGVDFLIKVDDDVLLDVNRVLGSLAFYNSNISPLWWWGSFKKFWRVQRSGNISEINLVQFGYSVIARGHRKTSHYWSKYYGSPGKWRDTKYQSATYPPFPCGAAYVLNRGVIKYVSAVAEQLQLFQGEDVSLGIWLSGLDISSPKTVANGQFSYQSLIARQCEMGCDWTCDNFSEGQYFCNLAQLSVPDVYLRWSQFIRDGFLR